MSITAMFQLFSNLLLTPFTFGLVLLVVLLITLAKVICFVLIKRTSTSSGDFFPKLPPNNNVNRRCGIPDCFISDLFSPESIYVKYFREKKDELVTRLYDLYNRTIFNRQLPESMQINWNKRLRKGAAYCDFVELDDDPSQRIARIQLSEKVLDSADRVCNTLVHEMCHAATWLINGSLEDHGSLWRGYATRAMRIHPELPQITEHHNYVINYKYTYECTRCRNRVGRFSKSLENRVCGLCKGAFRLLE